MISFVNSTDHAPEHRLFAKGMTLISQNSSMSTPSNELTTSNSASDTSQTYIFPKEYYQDNTGQVSRKPFDVACTRKRITDFLSTVFPDVAGTYLRRESSCRSLGRRHTSSRSPRGCPTGPCTCGGCSPTRLLDSHQSLHEPRPSMALTVAPVITSPSHQPSPDAQTSVAPMALHTSLSTAP